MSARDAVFGEPGKIALLLGNEAIARGALESGIGVATAYPGTPSSEVADTLSYASRHMKLYMEYSTNEKVALEVAMSASLSGIRSICSMKHVGLNVASDSFFSLAYVGTKAGIVVMVADDPNCYSSQNEQDSRIYALHAGVPCLEPSDPQEAKDMTIEAFQISEKLEIPVMLRTTTRVSHVRGNVLLGEIIEREPIGSFEKNPELVLVPANARKWHKVLLEKIEEAKKFSDRTKLNRIEGNGGEIGIISSGSAYNYAREACEIAGVEADFLKLGFTHPAPQRKIKDFLKDHEKVLVVEEVDPYLERATKEIAHSFGVETEINGKNLLPSYGELSVDLVVRGIKEMTGKGSDYILLVEDRDRRLESHSDKLVSRPPTLCPGCAHRAMYVALKEVLGDSAIYSGDIGCYTLGYLPPLRGMDTCFDMGASIGFASGLSKFVETPVVAVIGDSTFFHAGLPALVNLGYNKSKVIVVVMDNSITAMTGHQPDPLTGLTGKGEEVEPIDPEKVAKACGIEFVRVVDPYDLESTKRVLEEALEHNGPSVIIAKRPCALLESRRREKVEKYRVLEDKCRACRVCVIKLGCPAITFKEKAKIVEDLCTGCGVCEQICPFNAIVRWKENEEGD